MRFCHLKFQIKNFAWLFINRNFFWCHLFCIFYLFWPGLFKFKCFQRNLLIFEWWSINYLNLFFCLFFDWISFWIFLHFLIFLILIYLFFFWTFIDIFWFCKRWSYFDTRCNIDLALHERMTLIIHFTKNNWFIILFIF